MKQTMKKSIWIFYLLFLNIFIGYSQYNSSPKTIATNIIYNYVYKFNLEDTQSQWYVFLESLVSENDYLVFGEYHFSQNIQKLTNEFLSLGNKYGYTDFILGGD